MFPTRFRFNLLKNIFVIARFEFYESIRNKWLLVYGLSFLLLGHLLIFFGGDNPLQVSGSLLSLVILLVPVFSLIFGAISFTESLPFMELLVAKTLTRREIFLGKWLGLSLGLGISYALGIAGGSVVNLKFSETGIGAYFLLVFLGLGLNTCFLAISFFIANLSLRKEVVFGLVMAFWFYFFILYDLLIFGVTVLGGDFPLEFPVMIMSFLNPIDLVRIILTIHMDISSMMGYTGALYSRYLGGVAGIALGSGLLIIWTILPLIWGMRFFNRRNL